MLVCFDIGLYAYVTCFLWSTLVQMLVALKFIYKYNKLNLKLNLKNSHDVNGGREWKLIANKNWKLQPWNNNQGHQRLTQGGGRSNYSPSFSKYLVDRIFHTLTTYHLWWTREYNCTVKTLQCANSGVNVVCAHQVGNYLTNIGLRQKVRFWISFELHWV